MISFLKYKKLEALSSARQYVALRECNASDEQWQQARRRHIKLLKFYSFWLIILYLFMHILNASGFLLLFLDVVLLGGLAFWWWLSRYTYLVIQYGLEAQITRISPETKLKDDHPSLISPFTYFNVNRLGEDWVFKSIFNYRLKVNKPTHACYIPSVHYFFQSLTLDK